MNNNHYPSLINRGIGEKGGSSAPLSLIQLSLFRTELCRQKASTASCPLRENCPNSHCLSWHRRNPLSYPYRSMLCPNTRFWTEAKRMKVKTWCRRGRACLFAHTKEEQMYHPTVYKTQVCRDWPDCNKPFCPFAHGLLELREPDLFGLDTLQGPEMVDESVRHLVGEDKVRIEFERKGIENQDDELYTQALKTNLTNLVDQKCNPSLVVLSRKQSPNGDLEGNLLFMYVGSLEPPDLSRDTYEKNQTKQQKKMEILPDGSIAIPMCLVPTPLVLTMNPDPQQCGQQSLSHTTMQDAQTTLESNNYTSLINQSFEETNLHPEECILSFLTEDGCHNDNLEFHVY